MTRAASVDGLLGRVLVSDRRRKSMNLADAKVVFKNIIKARHDRLGAADLKLIDDAPTTVLAWQIAKDILTAPALPPSEAPGCCTYTIEEPPQPPQTFRITMTAAECAMIPGSSFDPTPCPPAAG
jgi:hypothetical protein